MSDLKALMLGRPRRTLAVAESITCGRIQAMVGSISGASDFFLGGITAYSLEEKVRHLGVDHAGAAATNSVSAAVARQMARGVCVLFGSDVGVSTTGYAEASPKFGVAEPFAWWGLARRISKDDFAVHSGLVDCPGLGRVEVQERVAMAAIDALLAWITEPAAGRKP